MKFYPDDELNHPFGGCRAKLNRARELLICLDKEVIEFFKDTSTVFNLVVEHRHDMTELHAIGKLLQSPPLRFGVLAGEIIHHLRSSLDHVIWALINKKQQTASERAQFPICISRSGWEKTVANGSIKGIGKGAFDKIASIQPFCQEVPKNTVLAALHQASNIDKHRVLLVLATAAALSDKIVVKDNPQFIGPQHPLIKKSAAIVGMSLSDLKPLSDAGTSLFSLKFDGPSPETTIDVEIAPLLVLEKLGDAENLDLLQLLTGLHQGTAHTIEVLESYL